MPSQRIDKFNLKYNKKETIKEENKVQEEQDIQIDLNVSSYIPDDFIQDSSQKIEIYQNIALCKTEKDIK